MKTYVMDMHIQHRQKRIRITFFVPIRFDGRPDVRLREHELRKFMQMKPIRVSPEKLLQQPLDSLVIHCRVGREKVE